MGAQWNQRGKPQYAGSYLCPDCCVGRRSARLSLLPFCQTASAFRLICLFHTFFRCGGYRAMVFAPLRCPKLFRFPFACLRAAPSACFAHLLKSDLRKVPEYQNERIAERCALKFGKWCGHVDLNPNALRHENLNLACLPISSCPHIFYYIISLSRRQGENSLQCAPARFIMEQRAIYDRAAPIMGGLRRAERLS